MHPSNEEIEKILKQVHRRLSSPELFTVGAFAKTPTNIDYAIYFSKADPLPKNLKCCAIGTVKYFCHRGLEKDYKELEGYLPSGKWERTSEAVTHWMNQAASQLYGRNIANVNDELGREHVLKCVKLALTAIRNPEKYPGVFGR